MATLTLDKTAPTGLALDAAATALLTALDHRGGDACGWLAVGAGGRIDSEKAPCDAADFNLHRRDVPTGTRALAVHTRMATQGIAAFNRNNHPVTHGHAYVVHNGIIWETPGERRRVAGQPEVDTFHLAVAASDNARRRKGESALTHGERIALACAKLDGSAAIGVALRSQAFMVTARLSHSPLYTAETKGVRVCASTAFAVSDAFAALDLEIPMREVQHTREIGRKRHKRQEVYTTYEEGIDYMPEGRVYVWDAGMHARGYVSIPQYAAADYWGEYYRPPTQVADKAYASMADALLDRGAERCELCDDVTDGPFILYGGLECCDACIRAMRASGATHESEVEA